MLTDVQDMDGWALIRPRHERRMFAVGIGSLLHAAALFVVVCVLPLSAFAEPEAAEPPAPAVMMPTADPGYVSPFANFAEALQFAENSFAFGDYDRVVRVLHGELSPLPARASTVELVDGYMFLGVSAWLTGDLILAEASLVEMLRLDRTAELDPFVFPPDTVAFFEEIRERHDLDAAPAVAEDQATVYIESRVREHSILVSILPFGYGLIANDEIGWGVFYALSESALLATSVSMFWLNQSDRRASDSLSVEFGYSDTALARRRKRVHIGTGLGFLALLTANVIHGAIAHDRGGEVRYRTLEEPPETAGFNASPQSNARRWRVRVAPVFEF